jgi:hypothetical protein
MTIDENIDEVKVIEGMGIWGNSECIQCGACCDEWNKHLYKINARKTEQCKNFVIQEGKAYCLNHKDNREFICRNYFCGNTEFVFRFREGGDKKLRKIAETLGTVPSEYKIPVLFL